MSTGSRVQSWVARLGAAYLLLLLASPASAQTAPPPGTWAQIPNTRQADAADPRFYISGPQALYNVRDLYANSGAALSKWNGVVGFFQWGGGHAATPDNSMFWIPLDGSGPRRLTGPYYDPAGDGNPGYYKKGGDGGNLAPIGTFPAGDPATVVVPGQGEFNGALYAPFGVWTQAPRSPHSTGTTTYAERNGQPIIFTHSGGRYSGPPTPSNDPRTLDLTQTFAQNMARPDMGYGKITPAPSVSGLVRWDPVNKVVFAALKTKITSYDPTTGFWDTNWPQDTCCTGYDWDAAAQLVIGGRWAYRIGDGLVERYNLDTRARQDLTQRPWAAPFRQRYFSYPPPYTSGFGMGWHSPSRRLVLMPMSQPFGAPPGSPMGQTLILIDPETDQVTTVTMTGTFPVFFASDSIYNRFDVIPGTDQVVMMSLPDFHVFIGTMPLSQSPQTVPAAPSGLTVTP